MDKRYNKHLKQNIWLEKGEQFCEKCKGKGKVKSSNNSLLICSKCYGVGKLDWIEKAMGKRMPSYKEMEEWIVDKMGEEICREIDNEIIEQTLKEARDEVNL